MTVSSLKAPVCVVLGKSSGIGGATTALVSERGYRVVVIGRDAEKLRKAQRLRAQRWRFRRRAHSLTSHRSAASLTPHTSPPLSTPRTTARELWAKPSTLTATRRPVSVRFSGRGLIRSINRLNRLAGSTTTLAG